MEETIRVCEFCNRIMPSDVSGNVCPSCKEEYLFSKVKDYIRDNEVNEYMVADHFQIPLRRVRRWIKEGRIEYVDIDVRIVGTTCQRCGKRVSFGTLCPECMRLLNFSNKKIQLAENAERKQKGEMRFLE